MDLPTVFAIMFGFIATWLLILSLDNYSGRLINTVLYMSILYIFGWAAYETFKMGVG